MSKKNIVMDPVLAVIKEMDYLDSSIILAGTSGSGKSVILNEFMESCEDIVVDGTLQMGENLVLRDNDIYNLYHTCLIVKKILLYIKEHFKEIFTKTFVNYEIYINNIIGQITEMHMIGLDRLKNVITQGALYKNPEILIDDLLELLFQKFGIEDIVVLLDDFDKAGDSSYRYQQYMYQRLRQHINLIMTFSDTRVVSDNKLLQKYANDDNIVIKIDYSRDLETVKDILDRELVTRTNCLKYRIRFMLSDDVILQMIEKTNGNLFDMIRAIKVLCMRINELSVEEYGYFVLKYIEDEINMSSILNGIIIPKRTLYI